MKVKDVLKAIEDDGWILIRQSGSHRQYRRPGNPNVLTVAGKPSATMREGTVAQIRRTTGLPLR